ncbi:hypothetical protein MIND_00596100 [Mycena indigotica]|uniref:Uncharacterized protein n=1 Tax=Mycena indigotica TaxID=2126181 RepID=A0A8H6SRP4_9AGAR|nr:uncharacterized protein MIND_00596100 [Mycena indigotica]KAF7303667.1 hypothetical protein MIND_00596100 [Mycena indigotica]
MKLLASFAVVCATLVTSALAQSVRIGAPADGAKVTVGSSLVVEIDRPDTLTPSTEIAIVIGFEACNDGPCPSPADQMGTILYNGPYKPEFQDDGVFFPHQNFTVTIPQNAVKGPSQLNVAHFALVGAVQFPLLQTRNVSLIVA